MALSLGTVLTPYMGRGQPTVEITGTYVYGFVNKGAPDITSNPRLFMTLPNGGSLATAVTGKTFILYVPATTGGRDSTLSDYLVGGLTDLSDYGAADSSVYVQDEYSGQDRPGSVRMCPATRELDSWSDHGSALSSQYGALAGTPVTVKIFLFGQIAALDLSFLRAGGIDSDRSAMLLQQYTYSDQPEGSRHNYQYEFPGYGWGTGWRTYKVRISDQPYLRGNVSNVPAYCDVIWE